MSNCKTIAVCNQKGGVGKTTTTVNLGVGLAMQGKKVLLIDADPQGDLTTCLGWQDTDGLGITLATKLTDVINETMTDPMVGILHHEEGVDLVPANLELSAMEFNLVNAMSRETTLKNYLSQVKNRYDYVIIDCMPSLGMVTLNALSAADSVIIPVQAQYLPAIRRIIRDCNDEQFLHSDEPDVLLPHFSCHSLRHTFTTRMCEAGVNIKVIQDALGHSDISTTLNIYADVTKEMKAAEFKGLDSYFIV